MDCGTPAGTSDGRWRQGQTRDQYLLMKPQGLLGEHGELLVRDGIQIDAGKVLTDVIIRCRMRWSSVTTHRLISLPAGSDGW